MHLRDRLSPGGRPAGVALALLLTLLGAPAQGQIDPEQELLRVSERGPKSKALDGADYDIAQESFHVFYPKRWSTKKAEEFGLFVWMSPMHYGVLPPMWKSLCEKRKLIAIGPDKAGNKRGTPTRHGLALDAVFHMLLRHPDLDPERIYVGGFSGGGNMACLLAWAHPDIFRGAIYIGGSVYHRSIPVVGVKDRYWSKRIKLPAPEVMKLVKERTTHVHLVGTEDTEALAHSLAIMGAMREDGFLRAHMLEVRGLGHELPKAKHLEKAFKLLDRKAKTPAAKDEPPTSRPTD